MSSTKRGGKRSPADNYPTPLWTVRRLLEGLHLPGGPWLEPGCGAGNIIRAVLSQRTDVTFTGVDRRATKAMKRSWESFGPSHRFLQGDLLNPTPEVSGALGPVGGPNDPYAFEVAVGNPPFFLAQEFIDFSLARAAHVVMLLRLNFVGSDKRSAFMRSTAPDLFVLPNRPPFKGDGKTDSIEYAWFHWSPHRERTSGRWSVLNTTSLEERRRG